MPNPYSPPPDHAAAKTLHPDWKWMSAMVYGICLLYLLAVPESNGDPRLDGETSPAPLPGPETLGLSGFYALAPLLALIPLLILAIPFRYLYRTASAAESRTGTNFLYLLIAMFVAAGNAMLYRGS